jgi:hypothetical protein
MKSWLPLIPLHFLIFLPNILEQWFAACHLPPLFGRVKRSHGVRGRFGIQSQAKSGLAARMQLWDW